MKLRQYQQASLDGLYQWWVTHPGAHETPLCVLPTGAGKSLVIAELCRLLFDTWPEDHPRTVVLVPSKELAEQNAQKLRLLLPSHLSVGYYSASLGPKQAMADVIVATIGSIYKEAHLLGNIRAVVIDEAHLVSTSGKEVGRYRQFLSNLAKLCQFRVVGYTATPFRGNGVWLTDGDDPLFTGVACTITIQELIDAGFLSTLIRPVDDIQTQISTEGISTTSGDYQIDQLSERVADYMQGVVEETMRLAAERKKWIAFTPTVRNAEHMAQLLNERGASCAVVCGDTPKREREKLIADFRAGRLRCLVTVLALATGFDVPDVDCLIWCRPTISPVLYVQGFGRAMRIAEGKENALVLDFTDTVARLGPIDTIKGRAKSKKRKGEAPFKVCDQCGERCSASASACPACGFVFPVQDKEAMPASNAAVLASQIAPKIVPYEVSAVRYGLHSKPGSPDSLRADYYCGLGRVASEWVCLEHGGFAGEKARNWWAARAPREYTPGSVQQALEWIEGGYQLRQPVQILVNETGKWPEIIRHIWEEPANAEHQAA